MSQAFGIFLYSSVNPSMMASKKEHCAVLLHGPSHHLGGSSEGSQSVAHIDDSDTVASAINVGIRRWM